MVLKAPDNTLFSLSQLPSTSLGLFNTRSLNCALQFRQQNDIRLQCITRASTAEATDIIAIIPIS